MVVGGLRIMVVTTRDDVAHVAGLHGIVAVLVHQVEGRFEMSLVVECTRRGLMVHHQLHALRVGIVVEGLDVEVGIGCHEVEDIVLGMAEPVFPSDVPTFDKHLVESVLGSEVDIFPHVLVVGSMPTVGLHAVPVDFIDFDRRELVGVAPRALAHNHLPPHTAVFRGVNPRGVFDGTGLVEVEDEV